MLCHRSLNSRPNKAMRLQIRARLNVAKKQQEANNANISELKNLIAQERVVRQETVRRIGIAHYLSWSIRSCINCPFLL